MPLVFSLILVMLRYISCVVSSQTSRVISPCSMILIGMNYLSVFFCLVPTRTHLEILHQTVSQYFVSSHKPLH